jgi:hypothetical protein
MSAKTNHVSGFRILNPDDSRHTINEVIRWLGEQAQNDRDRIEATATKHAIYEGRILHRARSIQSTHQL